MLNKVMLIGRLGSDPELKYFQDGSGVANFSIATTEKWKDKASGEVREKTEWHRIVAFRRLAEICGEYLSKGKQVYIEGKIQTREWADSDGARRFTTEIVAGNMVMLGSKSDSQASAPRPQQQEKQAKLSKPSQRSEPSREAGGSGYADDDIPF